MSPRGRTISRRFRNALIGGAGPIGANVLRLQGMQMIGGPEDSTPPGATRGPNLLVDGDMELAGVASWTALNGATLTKDLTTPHEGSQSLRVAYNGTSNPAAAQAVMTVGKTYRLLGWARSDGAKLPSVRTPITANLWVGTTSTSWQRVDITFLADSATIMFRTSATSAGWTGWDDLDLYE